MGLLGEGRLLAGVEKGLRGMCVSERRTITVPSHLAYGSTGAGKSTFSTSDRTVHTVQPILVVILLNDHFHIGPRGPERSRGCTDMGILRRY